MKRSFILFIVLLLAGCSGASYKTVTVEEAKKMIDDEEVIVLDVRTPEEYNSSHIPNSELIPLQIIDSQSEDLDKDQKYLIVCRSGNRSQQASDLLAQKGFKNIYNMTGGMNEWSYDVEQ